MGQSTWGSFSIEWQMKKIYNNQQKKMMKKLKMNKTKLMKSITYYYYRENLS